MTIRFNFFLLISLGLHLFLIFFLSFQAREVIELKEYISSINLEFSSYQRFDRPIDSDLYKTANKQGLIKEVYSKKLQTEKKENNEANKYVSAWQRKIETIGNLNYPDFIDSSSSRKLTLSVTIGKDGDLLDYVLIRASGNQRLDKAAMEIIELAFPFKEFPEEMAKISEITIIRDWNFGNQENLK